MGRFEKQMRRFTSLIVLVCFMTSLMAPALEAAALIPVKVPGRQVLFDVNTATAQELASIPGIGPKTAAEIVRYRSQFGPFKTIQDVGNVSGVGQARLSKLVGAATQAARPDLLLKKSPVKPAAAPAPAPAAKPVVATPEPPAVWVTGNNGSRVNVNISNSKTLVTQLVQAGFPNEQVNILANTRLVGNGSSLKFQPFKNLADLQTRLVSVGGKGIVDVAGAQIAQRTVSAPAAPSEPAVQTKPVPGVDGHALVYGAGERLMFRFDANGKAVTVNLNQQSASGLYKQLRAAGVPTSTAKAVAEARIKGTFKSFADLTSRVPQMDSVSRPAATRSAVTEPAAPAKQTVATPAAPSQAAEAQLAKLSQQYDAIVKRTPTSDTGYQRTIKSLQSTYDGMFKSLAEQAAVEGKVANADAIAKDARLQRIAKDIDTFSRNQANLAKAQNLNKATAALDVELAKYSKQADAVIQRSPTSLEGYTRTLDSLQSTYKDLYSRLEMKARLSGADASAEALVKDPRMQKIAGAIDNVRNQKAAFQSTKAANVEQARANEAKAVARKAAAQAVETPAAPVEDAAATRSTPAEQAAALKSRVEYTTRINEMSAQAKQLFTEIKAESGGRFTSNRDVWDAAKSYEGRGKLGELRKLGNGIQQMRQARNATFPAEQPVKEVKAPAPAKAKPAPAAEQPVKNAKATAPAETPAAPASEPQAAKPMTDLQKLSQQAKALNAKLLEGGQFKSAQEVYKASEVAGAKGELAQLKQVNEQLRSMRAGNKPVSQVAETPAGSAKASVTGDAAVATEAAAPKAKWTDGFLKAVKGGQFKSTDGGWADSYMKMLKGEGVVETARTASAPKASEIAAPTIEKAARSGGWADSYVKMLKGELAVDATASTAAPKQNWWSKLLGRRTASVPTAEAPAGRIAELPTDLPKASELGSTPARPADVKVSLTELQGQAKALNLKLKSTGQFTNSGEIYRASETAGATGDLATLKGINEQIRSLRAAKPGATVAAAESVAPAVSEPAPAPKTNKFMDWLTGKNTPGGKALASAKNAGTPAEVSRGSSIAELPAEAPTASKPAAVAKIEVIDSQISNLRTQAHETASGLVKSGQFNNVAEVVKAAEAPGATGKVAEVGKLNQNIKALTVEKATVANAAPAAGEGSSRALVMGKGLAELTGAAGSSTDFAVKFGNKVTDLGQMTAKQIETETGGLIRGDAA
jgi:competence protein ComEA